MIGSNRPVEKWRWQGREVKGGIGILGMNMRI